MAISGILPTVLAILAIASYLALIAIYRHLIRRRPRIDLLEGLRLERVSYRPRVEGREILRNMVLPGWGVSAAGDRWVGRFLMAAHAGFAVARLVAFTDVSRRLFDLALVLSFFVSMVVLFRRGRDGDRERGLRYELRRAAEPDSPQGA